MEDVAPLLELLRRTERRRRVVRGVARAGSGAAAGLAAGLVAVVVHRLFPVPDPGTTTLLLLASTGTVVGFIAGVLPSSKPIETARWLDGAAGLKERLSTALEMSSRKDAPPEWRTLILREASVAMAGVDPRRHLPFTEPERLRIALALGLALVAMHWVPPFRTAGQLREQEGIAAMKSAGTNLAEVVRQARQSRTNAPESVRRELESLEQLANRLQQGELKRDEALAALAQAADPLRRQAEALSKDPTLRRLERAARTPASAVDAASREALKARQQQLSEALGAKAAADPKGVEDLRDQARKLAEQARSLANQAGGDTAGSQAQAAAALASLSQQAQALGLDLPQIQAAMDALAQARADQMLKNLEQATKSLERMADMASEMSRLQQSGERRGRDLAEQLEFGEGEPALESLDRLMSQLGRNGGNKGEADQARSELERSLKSASDYGKVGEKLREALEKSRRGDTQGSGKALADAKAELKRLMAEAGNAQELMAAMEGLKAAKAAVASGRTGSGSGSEKGDGKGSGGNKGGSGVGTWAENTEWAFPESIADSWDNSGVSRPDQAARGNTDREPKQSGNLSPTKIPGRFQSGAPMPSIQLRGVGIKGESAVRFTEAVTSAQSDARAALSEDQVPKAYRGAVKDYFDDLPRTAAPR
jgi:exonuclease VII small subunit